MTGLRSWPDTRKWRFRGEGGGAGAQCQGVLALGGSDVPVTTLAGSAVGRGEAVASSVVAPPSGVLPLPRVVVGVTGAGQSIQK